MARSAPFLASLTSLTLAVPALADVTPSEVWANQSALFQAMGGRLSATLRVDGATTDVTGIRGDFTLPMGAGSVTMAIGDLQFLDNGDGTVTMRYPAGTDITMSVDITGAGSGDMTLRLLDAYDQVASGDPGDVTYRYDAPSLRMEFTDLNVAGPMFEDPELEMFLGATIDGLVTVTGNTGTLRATEGELVALSFEGAAESQNYDVTFATADGIVSTQKGSTGATTFAMGMELPAAGASLLALPAALRSGMAVRLQTEVRDNATDQTLMIGEELIQSQQDFTERLDMTLQVDADGLRIGGAADGFALTMNDTTVLPIPIELAIDSMTAAFDVPLLAEDQPQLFVFRLGLGGLTVSDTIWSLFDAGGALPRDAADLTIDLAGDMGTTIDLLDFQALEALEDAETSPFSIHALTIADLLVSAAGASLTGAGAFTFDMDDLESFDGMPAPTGSIDLRLVGGNTLIDTLIAMGLLPEDQAMGARMMLGMIARPDEGEDALVSTIEVDGAAGTITANGQRLK